MENIHALLKGMLEGKEYILKKQLELEWAMFKNGERRFFAPSANMYIDEDGRFIHWRHYGSSANGVSIENLKFLLEKIFECEPEDFVELSMSSILDTLNKGR